MKKTSLYILLIFLLTALIFVSGCADGDSTSLSSTTSGSSSVSSQETSDGVYRFCSSELDRYVIVYDGSNTDYYRLALKLEGQIYSKYRKRPSLARDVNTDSSKYEILLGDVSSAPCKGRIMECSVSVDEGRLIISAGGAFSAEKAITYLCDNLFNGKDFALETGEYYKRSFLSPAVSHTDGISARVMSANILSDTFASDSYSAAGYRAELFAGMLISYTPDALGLQETDEAWSEALDLYLPKLKELYGISYSRHLATFEGKTNYTSLLYRSDKFKVEDSGVEVFSWWIDPAFNHGYHMRNISWAVLSSLDAPTERFALANTHWSYRTEHADGKTSLSGADTPIAANELRLSCKDETNGFMTSLRETCSDIPIFLVGDLNTSLPFFTDYGWTPDSFRIVSEEAKANGTAASVVPVSNHFDHIFGFGNYSVKHYDFFNDTNHHSELSDHPFVYADVVFS